MLDPNEFVRWGGNRIDSGNALADAVERTALRGGCFNALRPPDFVRATGIASSFFAATTLGAALPFDGLDGRGNDDDDNDDDDVTPLPVVLLLERVTRCDWTD